MSSSQSLSTPTPDVGRDRGASRLTVTKLEPSPTSHFPKVQDVYPPHAIEWKPEMYSGHLNPTLMVFKSLSLPGVLMVRVKSAQHLFKTHNFGKPELYVEIQIGEDIRKTGIATHDEKKRTSHPRWETTLQFALKGGERTLQITVYNKRTLGADMVGRAIVSLPWVLQLARPSIVDEKRCADDSVPRGDGKDPTHSALFYLGREKNQRHPAGEVLLSITFYPHYEQTTTPIITLGGETKVIPSTGSLDQRPAKNPKYRTQPEELLDDIRKGYNLHPPKRRKGQPPLKLQIFGGDLKNAIALSGRNKIPKPLYDTITYLRATGLDEVGLFRVPGNNDEILRLKKAYDAHIDVGFADAHDAGGVLKLYLRELPEPLIPNSHYEHFIRVDTTSEPSKQMEQYRVLISSIPPENRETLRVLLEFLYQVSEKSEKNKMDLANIAIVFAPNLFRPRLDGPGASSKLSSDMQRALICMQTLIKEYNQLFPKPKEVSKPVQEKVEKDLFDMDQGELIDLIRSLQEKINLLETATPSEGKFFPRSPTRFSSGGPKDNEADFSEQLSTPIESDDLDNSSGTSSSSSSTSSGIRNNLNKRDSLFGPSLTGPSTSSNSSTTSPRLPTNPPPATPPTNLMNVFSEGGTSTTSSSSSSPSSSTTTITNGETTTGEDRSPLSSSTSSLSTPIKSPIPNRTVPSPVPPPIRRLPMAGSPIRGIPPPIRPPLPTIPPPPTTGPPPQTSPQITTTSLSNNVSSPAKAPPLLSQLKNS